MRFIIRLMTMLQVFLSVTACGDEIVQTQQVGPGTELRIIEIPEVPRQIRVLGIDLRNDYLSLETIKAGDRLFALEQTSSMAQRNTYEGHVVLGAINGDFYVTSGPTMGAPIGTQVINGIIIKAPDWRSTILIDQAGVPHIATVNMSASLILGSSSYPLTGVNEERGDNQIILFNRFFGNSTGTNDNGLELTCEYIDSLFFVNDTLRGVITDKRSGLGNSLIPADGFVISASGEYAVSLDTLVAVGDTLFCLIRFPQVDARIVQAVSGGPILLHQGEIQVSAGGAIHPRTSVGFTADRDSLFFLVVDGRQEGYSIGVSLYELAQLMKDLGCTEAMNLDGGGSSTMVVRGEVVNSPSDPWGERPVSNSLQLISSAPTGNLAFLRINPRKSRIFREQQIQFSISGTDSFYNPINLEDSLLIWSCSPGLGSITSEGLFTAGVQQDTGYIICEIGQISDSLLLVVDSLRSLLIAPEPFVVKSCDTVQFFISGLAEGEYEVELPQDSLTVTLTSGLAELLDEHTLIALSAGIDTMVVSCFKTTKRVPIYINIDSLDILNDDFSTLFGWQMSGSGIHPYFTHIDLSNTKYVSSPSSLKLEYYFVHTGGSHRVDLEREILVPGEISSISMNIYGNGKGHTIYWELEDCDGEIFNYYLVTQENWGRQWQYVESPVSYIIPGYQNIGASLDFPIRLKKMVVYLSGGVPNQTEHDSLFFDDLTFHYRPLALGPGQRQEVVAQNFILTQPYPNPFNNEVLITYLLPGAGKVEVTVYDMNGCLVKILESGEMGAGLHETRWNGRSQTGEFVSSGIYLVQVRFKGWIKTRKMLLLK